MKISHESPLALLEHSRLYNDYDYALVHLFEEIPEYYKFFEQSIKQGRKVLLDNSIFELGTAFDTKKFLYWILRLNPTEYIIPDVLENASGTMNNALEWKENYLPLIKNGSKSIGVVQGKDYTELVQCYSYLDTFINVDKIAFSFDYSFYKELCPHPNPWMAYVMGRTLVLSQMLKDGIINKDKPHHLLGCALPIEFMFYRDYKWIETIDTSNPIVHGLLGIEYDYGGMTEKQSIKLVELIHSVPDTKTLNIINRNISIFRSFVRGKE